ncbi:MAG: Omp28-related outer membrane protein [Hyphomicrobiales bacterium]
MKTIKHITIVVLQILILSFGSTLFQSCDKVEAPYKIGGDTPTPDPDPGTSKRKTILFEFTGHQCVNCPAAAEIAKEQKEAYNDKLVVVAVHYGFFARPAGGAFSRDYRTEIGNTWGDDLNISSLPKGVINWKPSGDKLITESGEWGNIISSFLVSPEESVVNIGLNVVYDEQNKKATINTTSKFNSGATGEYNLTVLVVEDKITSAQKDGAEIVEDYVHNHVLRQGLTDAYGDRINSGNAIQVNTDYSKEYTLDIKPEWVPENLSIIAFVSKASAFLNDREVVQVIETHLK